MTGIERIAAERQRQLDQEGWTPEHDNQHTDAALALAALCYLKSAVCCVVDGDPGEIKNQAGWPWYFAWWKPSADPIRNLEKAGALIAAEIDRLQRKGGK